jgi:hypothetical protein
MMIGSSDFLRLLADNDCHLVFEKGAPAGALKRDFISLKRRDGRDLALSTPQGYQACPVELPRSIFDDFLAASLIRKGGPTDQDQRIIYNLTIDGVARGLTIDYNAQANVAVWDEPDENGLAGATVMFDGINFAEAVRRVMAMPADQRAKVASVGTDARLYEVALIEAITRRSDFPRGN